MIEIYHPKSDPKTQDDATYLLIIPELFCQKCTVRFSFFLKLRRISQDYARMMCYERQICQDDARMMLGFAGICSQLATPDLPLGGPLGRQQARMMTG